MPFTQYTQTPVIVQPEITLGEEVEDYLAQNTLPSLTTTQLNVQGAITSGGTITCPSLVCSTALTIPAMVLGGSTVTATGDDLQRTTGVTPGTATASKVLVCDTSKNISGLGTVACGILTSTGSISTSGTVTCWGLTLGNTAVTATAGNLNQLAGVTAGTASASKALVCNASRNISNLNAVTCTTLTSGTVTFTGTPAVSATATDVTRIIGVTPGTATASKVLVCDTNKNISEIGAVGCASITLGGVAVTATASELNRNNSITPGIASAGKVLVCDTAKNISSLGNVSCTSLTVAGSTLQFQGIVPIRTPLTAPVVDLKRVIDVLPSDEVIVVRTDILNGGALIRFPNPTTTPNGRRLTVKRVGGFDVFVTRDGYPMFIEQTSNYTDNFDWAIGADHQALTWIYDNTLDSNSWTRWVLVSIVK